MTMVDEVQVSRPSAPRIREPRDGQAHQACEQDLLPLFERWQYKGDRVARDTLVEHFLPLAKSLARRYLRSSESADDLVQVASLGLVKAIDRFDVSRGCRFAAFAVPTILGELRRYFRDTSWAVHVSRGAQEKALEVEEASELLTSRHGHAPTVNEIAQYLELSNETVLNALQVGQAYNAVSLDAPARVNDEETASYTETLGREDPHYELVEDDVVVGQVLKSLSSRERHILYLRFVKDLTQSEIAAEVGLSQMQISRLLRRSLEHARKLATDDDLEGR
jgi:RNA polymerase sigma-B factor